VDVTFRWCGAQESSIRSWVPECKEKRSNLEKDHMKYSSPIILNKSGPSKIIAEQPIDIALTVPRVKIMPGEKAVSISMIFKWYRSDLGGSRQGLIDTLLAFLDEGDRKDFLKQNRDRVRIRYQPYDWNLNQEIGS
jgi:hypothetical protein